MTIPSTNFRAFPQCAAAYHCNPTAIRRASTRSACVKPRVLALALAFCLAAATVRADWRDVCGFTRLQLLAGGELPGAPSQGLTHVEATDGLGAYAPDTASSAFSGKTFTDKGSGAGISSHATHVATNFYGNTSPIPGTTAVDLYDANTWLNAGFLKFGYAANPLTESRAVQNHSWVVETDWSAATVEEANRRIDFAINRDGFVCVVGSDNNGLTTLPQFLCQSYHTISVGRDDGGHSAGFTAYDISGRIKPDIVAPSAAPEYATSWTTPMVAGTAGLLAAKLSAAPYSLTGADKPRVVKALLLASASKNTLPAWSNTSSRPLDLHYGAGVLNAWHAYSTLRNGKAAASNNTLCPPRGWAAESVSGNASKTYFFTIPAGASATPFSSCLTWHRTVTRSGFSWSATLANLDLRFYQAGNFTLGTLVASSLSAVDNVELVYQPTLVPGNYALVVTNTSATTITYGLAWHSLPAVTVAATTATAREIDGQPGVITLTRTGDTSLPLYVPLTIGGTAIAGTHYQSLPGSITIPAGQASATLQITPVADQLAQGERTVSVAVAADFALVGDPAQAALVTIQDKPFDAWRFAHFTGSELATPSISGETADPDGDRIANLIEYALALAPKSPNALPVTLFASAGYQAIAASKNPAATDISWNAEIAGQLDSWGPAVITTNTASAFAARDNVLKSSAAKRFIRLKITRP